MKLSPLQVTVFRDIIRNGERGVPSWEFNGRGTASAKALERRGLVRFEDETWFLTAKGESAAVNLPLRTA